MSTKYGRMICGNNKKQLQSLQYVNLGDYFQMFAIDNLYQRMGIAKEDIVDIYKADMTTYVSDDTILFPMQGWFGYIKGLEVFPLAKCISPVFLGYHCVTKAFYKDCSPYQGYLIGCRDEETYKLMKKYKQDAFLFGCMTITLPKREKAPENGKIFLVDAPEDIEAYIPEKYKDRIVYITQEIPIDTKRSEEEEVTRITKYAHDLLDRYKNEAALVVTSRLHCAAPCLGMGIPVIMARKYFDARYQWIDKFLDLYTPDRYSEINWDAEAVNIDDIKEKMTQMAISLFQGTPDRALAEEIHSYYMDRTRKHTATPFYVKAYFKLHEMFPKTADFVREVLLKRFTVATGRGAMDESGEDS